MPGTLLAIGAHFDDCVFGIPGILLQAVRKHYRVVIVSIIGDYTNRPASRRNQEILESLTQISSQFGAEMRFLPFASHQFELNMETKRSLSALVAEVKPDLAFMLWPSDTHHDHEIASDLSKIALQHGDRVLGEADFRPVSRIYVYDNGPRHTIGFEPDTFVDITPDFQQAVEWLGRFRAVMRNETYDGKELDHGQRAKEVLARYRGQACGVQYAEAVRGLFPQPREIL